MKTKSYIKRLSLPKFLHHTKNIQRTYKKPDHDVVFHQNGFYYNRLTKDCWYEVKINRIYFGFSESPQSFLWDFNFISHIPLTNKQIESIETILDYTDDEKLEQLLYWDDQYKFIRSIKRDGMRRR